MIFLVFFQVVKTLFIIIIIIIGTKENDDRNFVKQFGFCNKFYNGRILGFVFRAGGFVNLFCNND